jgi:hypothetical protein
VTIPPLTESTAQAVSDLLDQDRQPTHYDLERLFRQSGLTAGDPKQADRSLVIGKRKRVREVLMLAAEHDPKAGARLVADLTAVVRGVGGFRAGSDNYVGDGVVANVRAAFRAVGFDLGKDGSLAPLVLDSLTGAELTDALGAYVRRAQAGATDAALVTGTGKDLLEAVARHVLVERTGTYNDRMDFPMTLYHAFYAVDLATPPGPVLDAWEKQLDDDPTRRLAQTLYLLGLAVNRLRNKEGTGHGRPFAPTVTDADAKVAIEGMGIVSEMVLEKHKRT